MTILLILGLIITFITIFIVMHFSVEKLRTTKWFQRINFSVLVFSIIIGLLFGIMTLIFQFIFYKINYAYLTHPFFYFITAIILIKKREVNASLISLILPLIFSYFFFPIDNFSYFLNAILFATLTILVILKEINATEKNSFIVVSVFIFVALLSLILVSSLSWKIVLNLRFFILIFTPLIILIITYGIIAALEIFFISANLLHESINYVHSTYLRESIYEERIKKYIQSQKINSGLYGLLRFETNHRVSQEGKQEMIKQVLNEFEHKISNKTILFKSNQHMYGFFIPMELNNIRTSLEGNNLRKRKPLDELKFLEKIVFSISKKYEIHNKKQYLSIDSSVVLYGVQEMIINRLHSLSLFGFESMQSSSSNKVGLFNPLFFKRRSQDSREIKKLHAALNIALLTNEFFPIYNTVTKDTLITTSKATSSSQLNLDYNSIISYVKSMGVDNILNRFLAGQVVKAFGHSLQRPMGIKYSVVDIASPNFSMPEFLIRLSQSDTKPSRLILLFDEKEINDFPNKELLKDIFAKLQKKNIKIALINAGHNEEKFQEIMDLKINFNYLFLDPKLYHSNLFNNTYVNSLRKLVKIKAIFKGEIIADQIRNEVELVFIIETGIKNIGGTLFTSHQLQPQLFDKKSKIYIEEMIKG